MSAGKTVLDCFSHTGGFALNAAIGGAKHVTAVDVSQTALDQGLANAKMNHLEERMSFVQDDVFDYLDKCHQGQYDIIVLIHLHLLNQEELSTMLIMAIRILI